ncbi:four-carbon acid sugar kinase family protein [Paenarthrobacter sp. NPDC058040]|uniref:four-carbon acid sugar kinase family protein n=1 Tax=unclassified Paenarthrobacter TaxID=2634190 RepID=UPI0036DEFF15
MFLGNEGVILFAPSFPDGGRTTRDGVHYVRIEDREIPAHESEYAQDPVFPFTTGVLAEYVAEKSSRSAISVTAGQVHNGELAQILTEAPAGAVIIPDAVDSRDIAAIAAAVNSVTNRQVVVRSAAPLAAELAGVPSRHLLRAPLVGHPVRVLVVCGSHTQGASAQLRPLADSWGHPAVVDTAAALDAPLTAGLEAADRARLTFDGKPVVMVATERTRSAQHNTLAHGENIMSALTTAVRSLLPSVAVVVAKGGITSAETARHGIGATSALVLGQILPGISVWQLMDRAGRELLYVVVPGNVGGPETLKTVLESLNVKTASAS